MYEKGCKSVNQTWARATVDSFGTLLASAEETGDITLVLGSIYKTEIRVHKLILTTRSPVFAAMFKHDTKENIEGRVNIADIDIEACRDFIKYLYTGQIHLMQQNAQQLMIFADKVCFVLCLWN